MSWYEQELKAAFAAGLEGPPGPDCPAPEVIWDALNLALPPRQRYRVILHTAACPHCAQAWQAAKMIADEAGLRPPAPDPAAPWWQRWLRAPVLVPALAGSAALLVALVWLGPREPGPLAPPVDSGVMRGHGDAPQLLTADGAVLAPGATLSWRDPTGASHHKIVLYSPDGERRLELPVSEPMVLDAEVVETFGPGATVLWYVVAIDGPNPGAESEVRTITLPGEP